MAQVTVSAAGVSTLRVRSPLFSAGGFIWEGLCPKLAFPSPHGCPVLTPAIFLADSALVTCATRHTTLCIDQNRGNGMKTSSILPVQQKARKDRAGARFSPTAH